MGILRNRGQAPKRMIGPYERPDAAPSPPPPPDLSGDLRMAPEVVKGLLEDREVLREFELQGPRRQRRDEIDPEREALAEFWPDRFAAPRCRRGARRAHSGTRG